jgi:hypothetical protein
MYVMVSKREGDRVDEAFGAGDGNRTHVRFDVTY